MNKKDKKDNVYQTKFKAILERSRQLSSATFVLENITQSTSETYKNLTNFATDKYSIAPNGGAIAIAHSQLKDEDGYQKVIHVYDSHTNLLHEIELTVKKKLFDIYLTPEECLVAVYTNGTVISYHLRGFEMSKVKEYNGEPIVIVSVSFWPRGMFVVDSGSKIWIIEDFASLNPKPFCDYAGASLGKIIARPPNQQLKRGALLWACNTKGEIVLIQEGNFQTAPYPVQLSNIVFSPDGSFVVNIGESHYLFSEPDMNKVLLNLVYDDTEPNNILWCGNDTILLLCDKTLVMLGAAEQAIHWELESTAAGVSEVDGVRIFTKEGVFLVRSIEGDPLQFALWNTKSPSVRLFPLMLDEKVLAIRDVLDEFSIDELENAIQGCLSSALFYQPNDIRSILLKMISRTLTLIKKPSEADPSLAFRHEDLRDFQGFAEKISTLRICTSMNEAPYNMPLTFHQFNDITSSVLLTRLCNRSYHLEAYKIAQYLHIEGTFIAAHWANCLIRSELTPEQIIEKIDKMDEPIDFIDLATTAFNLEKPALALALLNHNPAKARGVPLLISENKWEEALSTAVDSADTSLISYSLNEAKNNGQNEALQKCLDSSAIARDIWLKLSSEEEQREIRKQTQVDQFDKLKETLADRSKEFDYKMELKKNKDLFHLEIFNTIKNMDELDKVLVSKGQSLDGNLSAIEKFEKIIDFDDEKATTNAVKAMGFTKEEALFRQFLYFTRTNKGLLLQKVMNKVKGPQRGQFQSYLSEHGKLKLLEEVPPEQQQPSKKKKK